MPMRRAYRRSVPIDRGRRSCGPVRVKPAGAWQGRGGSAALVGWLRRLVVLAGARQALGFLILVDFPGRSARVAHLCSTLSHCFLLIIFLTAAIGGRQWDVYWTSRDAKIPRGFLPLLDEWADIDARERAPGIGPGCSLAINERHYPSASAGAGGAPVVLDLYFRLEWKSSGSGARLLLACAALQQTLWRVNLLCWRVYGMMVSVARKQKRGSTRTGSSWMLPVAPAAIGHNAVAICMA